MDIRQAPHHLGEIIPAREITPARGRRAPEVGQATDDLPENIFSKFCPARPYPPAGGGGGPARRKVVKEGIGK